MLLVLSAIDIYICTGNTDMCKAINGLTKIMKDYINQNPLSGSLNMSAKRVKAPATKRTRPYE
jgi:hypothetical protein